MRISRRLPVLLVLLAALASTGCAALAELFRDPEETVAPMVRPDWLYETVSENYIELCAVSQYRPLEGRMGGSPGHAVMYLKGACRDESAGYPRLRPCRYSTADRADPEHGAGVSVNRLFKNVNWVATPGKTLFFDGEVGDYDLLDRERFDQTVTRAIDTGMYNGIEFHPLDGEDEPPELRRVVEIESVGTDFALRFGRTVFCTRLPVPREMLIRAMDYLNDLNDEYARGEADYNWSGYSDNCVHTLHNALAAAGVWKPKSVGVTKLRQLANLAVPANTFVELAYLINKYPVEDFNRVRRDDVAWKTLVEDHWLPAAPGGLVKMMPVLQVNTMYDTKYRMFVLGGFFTNDAKKRAQRMLVDGRYLQLDANLRYFYDRYQEILAARDDSGSWRDAFRDDDYQAERELYYAYITRERDRVREVAQRLQEYDRVRREILERAGDEWKARFEPRP
jgi:hypothetical protein